MQSVLALVIAGPVCSSGITATTQCESAESGGNVLGSSYEGGGAGSFTDPVSGVEIGLNPGRPNGTACGGI